MIVKSAKKMMRLKRAKILVMKMSRLYDIDNDRLEKLMYRRRKIWRSILTIKSGQKASKTMKETHTDEFIKKSREHLGLQVAFDPDSCAAFGCGIPGSDRTCNGCNPMPVLLDRQGDI